jgi:hypothetical protein
MATISTPARQPFGLIDGARLRNLGNVKNVQNGMPLSCARPYKHLHLPLHYKAPSWPRPSLALPAASLSRVLPVRLLASMGIDIPEPALAPSQSSSAKTLKRRHDLSPEIDSENIDPLLNPSKKAKGNAASTPQKPHFALKQRAPASVATTRQILTPKKLAKKSLEVKPVSFSAPAGPAGRSPKSKRIGILSRRRISGYGRVDPPSFGLCNAPFSIDAALSGTVSSYDPTPTKTAKNDNLELSSAAPSSWLFEIHEDTLDEELGNLVQHSTQTLDLSSDDETKAREVDLRGKENIPPETINYAPVTRRDLMTDEPRTPLGDLDASEFYAEGCDANSFIIVDGQEIEKPKAVIPFATADNKGTCTTSPTDTANNQEIWRELLAQVERKQDHVSTPTEPSVEVWESESAKGDEEPVNEEVVSTSTPLEQCMAEAEQREESALASA